jgi:hypothetical protein
MPFNTAVVTLNFVTLFCYVCIQCFFGCAPRQRPSHARISTHALPRHSYREYWCIEAFDEEPTLSGDNLKTELELYPKFKATLFRLNSWAFVLALGLDVLVIACVSRFAEGCAYARMLSHRVLSSARSLALLALLAATWWSRRCSSCTSTPPAKRAALIACSAACAC